MTQKNTVLLIDAQKIADWLGVSLKEFAPAIHMEFIALRENSSPLSAQTELYIIQNVLEILSKTFKQHEDRLNWLNYHHPDLGNRKPMDVILSGHAEAVRVILSNAVDGLPS